MKILGAIDDASEAVPTRGRRGNQAEHDSLFERVVYDTHSRVPNERRGHRWLKVEVPDLKAHDKLCKAIKARALRGGWEFRCAWRAGATKEDPGITYLMVVNKPAAKGDAK